MNPLSVEIIGGLVVAMLTVIASFILAKLLRTDSPLPQMPGAKPKDAFQFLGRKWVEYHLTSDKFLYPDGPYWLQDTFVLEIRQGHQLYGILDIPRPGDIAKYKMLGEIRQGRLIITGANIQDPSDFFTVIFPELIGKGNHPIVGTMIGFDWNGRFYAGPMILSTTELDVDCLKRTAATGKPIDFWSIQNTGRLIKSFDLEQVKNDPTITA